MARIDKGLGSVLGDAYRNTSIDAVRNHRSVEEAIEAVKVSYADVNSDGEDELIITAPYGAHGYKMTVFGQRFPGDFEVIGEIRTALSMDAFQIHDHDGRVEITVTDTDYDRGPHAAGYLRQVTYRWTGDGFEQVGSHPIPSDTDPH